MCKHTLCWVQIPKLRICTAATMAKSQQRPNFHLHVSIPPSHLLLIAIALWPSMVFTDWFLMGEKPLVKRATKRNYIMQQSLSLGLTQTPKINIQFTTDFVELSCVSTTPSRSERIHELKDEPKTTTVLKLMMFGIWHQVQAFQNHKSPQFQQQMQMCTRRQ